MLSDPFVLKAPTLSSHSSLTVSETVSLARKTEQSGTATYGPTKAGSDMQVSMRISHSESNENKPTKTSRVLVRIDINGVGADLKPLNAFAYAVIGMPKADLYGSANEVAQSGTPLDATQLTQFLLAALATNNSTGATDETKIPRLIAGES